MAVSANGERVRAFPGAQVLGRNMPDAGPALDLELGVWVGARQWKLQMKEL